MRYTIRAGAASGGFRILAAGAAEALMFARMMLARGLDDVRVFDANGTLCAIETLEQAARSEA